MVESSDVFIETSGGTDPIKCYGHHRQHAVKMKELIERHQSAYFRTPAEERGARPGLLSSRAVADKQGVKT